MRRIYWGGAASRLFARRWMRPIWRALHVMPVDERRPASTLALAAAVLARGDSLIWFPETWRSPDGSLQRFQPGVGKLVVESGAPAIPVFIGGTFDALPRGRRLPRLRPLHVRIGTPLDLTSLTRGGEGAQPHLDVTNALRDAVAALGEQAPVLQKDTAA
jgi:long-chain acyl-CoA synthetase